MIINSLNIFKSVFDIFLFSKPNKCPTIPFCYFVVLEVVSFIFLTFGFFIAPSYSLLRLLHSYLIILVMSNGFFILAIWAKN